MTTKFIHPFDGLNTNPGSQDKPWKDLSNLSTEPWDEALIARNTQLLISSKTRLSKLNNKYIGTYGSGENPEISSYRLAANWLEVFPNVWQFRVSDVWAPVTFLCFGKLGSYGTRVSYFDIGGGQTQTLPSADKEWDTETNPLLPTVIYVYAPENPTSYYGNIYYQTRRDPVFQVSNCDNIIIEDISYKHTSSCIRVFNDDGNIHKGCKFINNIATDVASFISLVSFFGWIEDFEVTSCKIHDCHNNGIYLSKFLRNGKIINNQITGSGLVESTGAIYIGDSFAPKEQPILIKGNRVENTKYSCYWPVDGAGIYADSNSQNINITQNAIFNSHVGIKSNSGKPGLKVFENFTNNCDIGYEEGDSDGYDLADTKVYYNNFLNCSLNNYYPVDPINRPLAAIRYFNQGAISAKYNFYSNEITGRGGKGLSTRKPINNYNNRFIGFAN